MAIEAELFTAARGGTAVAVSDRIPVLRPVVRRASYRRVPLVLGLSTFLALVVAMGATRSWTVASWVYTAGALAVMAASGAFRLRITLRGLEETPWIVGRMAIPLVAVAPVVVLGGAETALFAQVLVAIAVVVVLRCVIYAGLRAARRRGHLVESCVILGAGAVGVELAHIFRIHREFGLEPIGYLDRVRGDLKTPLLGDVRELDRVLDHHDVQRVIVAFGPTREADLVGVLRTAIRHDVEVHVVPRFFDVGAVPEGPGIDSVRGIPLYQVRRAALRAWAWRLKRFVDVMVGGATLVLLAPIFGVVALAVRLTSPGPVLFRQGRVGQDGREIQVLKFRTLRVNQDSDTQWAVGRDRLTPVGGFLRRTSLDEMPQLWSVLKGDMSLVGPRPERPFFVERFNVDIDGYGDRHRVPVGLTGWAQVHGLRGDTSIKERARFDNQYIEHWSLWRDFVILMQTTGEVLRNIRRSDGPKQP